MEDGRSTLIYSEGFLKGHKNDERKKKSKALRSAFYGKGKETKGLKKTKNGFFSYPLLANSELLLKCFKLLHLIDDRYKSAFLNSGLMTAVQG